MTNLYPPPENRRFLAYAVSHGFYETTPKGVRPIQHRRVLQEDVSRNEIEILKKVQHNHIIRILRPYALPGLLLWPLAVCDLATFLGDVEEVRNQLECQEKLTKIGKLWPTVNRLYALLGSCDSSGVITDSFEDNTATEGIYSVATALVGRCYGCIMSAVSYLHEQGIYRNELIPEKILLSPSGLWLTDFETSPTFLNLNMGATDNGMSGARDYIAPEVIASYSSGISLDIFSLGCIFFEMTAVYARVSLGSLYTLRTPRGVSP